MDAFQFLMEKSQTRGAWSENFTSGIWNFVVSISGLWKIPTVRHGKMELFADARPVADVV
jgi:hypothetical protein